MIQRWDFDDCPVSARDGYYVLYVEHLEVLEAALAAERAKVRELVEVLRNVLSNVKTGHFDPGNYMPQPRFKWAQDALSLIEKYSKEEPNVK